MAKIVFHFIMGTPLLQHLYTVEFQWLESPWNHENMFETGVVRAMSVNHSARSGGRIGLSFRFSLL